jgi:hypothetical protein
MAQTETTIKQAGRTKQPRRRTRSRARRLGLHSAVRVRLSSSQPASAPAPDTLPGAGKLSGTAPTVLLLSVVRLALTWLAQAPVAAGETPASKARMTHMIPLANAGMKRPLKAGEKSAAQRPRSAGKRAFGLKVAQCLRAHGYPKFPDPTASGQQSLPPGIHSSSPQFQAAEKKCEEQARKELSLT